MTNKKYFTQILFTDIKGNDTDLSSDHCLGIFESYEEGVKAIEDAVWEKKRELEYNKRKNYKPVNAYGEIFEMEDEEDDLNECEILLQENYSLIEEEDEDEEEE